MTLKNESYDKDFKVFDDLNSDHQDPINDNRLVVFVDEHQKINKLSNFKDFLEENITSLVFCPFTCVTMFSPVLGSDGFLYEESQLDKFFRTNPFGRSPFTREKMIKTETRNIQLINDIIDYCDKCGLEVTKDKFIQSNSFEDNFDVICTAFNNGMYDSVMKFSNFKLGHVDFTNRTFCELILRVKAVNDDAYVKCIKYILDNSTDLSFNVNTNNILHIFMCVSLFPSLINYAIGCIKTKLKVDINTFNVINQSGKTPMDYLFDRGNASLLECGLNSGIDFGNDLPRLVMTLIQTAQEDSVVIKMLDKLENKNIPINNTTPLFLAIKSKKLAVVKYLLDKNIDVYWKNNLGINAIHYACQNYDLEIVKLLMSKCKDIEEETDDGWRILHTACYYSTKSIITYILDMNPQVIIPIKKFQGKNSEYLPLNLIELNTKLGSSDFESLIENIIELMQIQFSS